MLAVDVSVSLFACAGGNQSPQLSGEALSNPRVSLPDNSVSRVKKKTNEKPVIPDLQIREVAAEWEERTQGGSADAQSLETVSESLLCLRPWTNPGLVARDNGPRHGNRMWDYVGPGLGRAIIDDYRSRQLIST